MMVQLIKNRCSIVLISASLLVSPLAYAEKLYVGFGLSQLNYQRDNVQRAILPDGDPSISTTKLCGYRVDGDYSSCTNANNGRVSQTFDADTDIDMFSLKIGYQFTPNFSMEIRSEIATSEAKVDDYTEDFSAYTGQSGGPAGQQLTIFVTTPQEAVMKANRNFGLYARLGGSRESSIKYVDRLLLNGVILSPYFLVGYDSVKYTTSVSGGGIEGHSYGKSIGYGLNFYLDSEKPFAFNFEVRRLEDKDDSSLVLDQQFKFGIDFLF